VTQTFKRRACNEVIACEAWPGGRQKAILVVVGQETEPIVVIVGGEFALSTEGAAVVDAEVDILSKKEYLACGTFRRTCGPVTRGKDAHRRSWRVADRCCGR